MPDLDDVITEEEARIYEFCVLYPANLSQKEESELLKEVEKTIEEHGGKQIRADLNLNTGVRYQGL